MRAFGAFRKVVKKEAPAKKEKKRRKMLTTEKKSSQLFRAFFSLQDFLHKFGKMSLYENLYHYQKSCC